jgi:hypothetical protein
MITTYDSNCFKCLSGSMHPWHDNGEPAEVTTTDPRFSQLPPERRDRIEHSHKAKRKPARR